MKSRYVLYFLFLTLTLRNFTRFTEFFPFAFWVNWECVISFLSDNLSRFFERLLHLLLENLVETICLTFSFMLSHITAGCKYRKDTYFFFRILYVFDLFRTPWNLRLSYPIFHCVDFSVFSHHLGTVLLWHWINLFVTFRSSDWCLKLLVVHFLFLTFTYLYNLYK